MSEIMNVPFSRPSIGQEEKDAVLKVLESGWLTTGDVTHKFENEFAAFVGSKFALAVNSNTSGMILAMEACGVKENTAVITTPYTFVSTAACARHLGADVYFADIEKDSYSIDPEKIEEILIKDSKSENPKVRAIVPVHIAGNLCNMEKINALAKKYSTPQKKIYVIEDAAHSFPSRTKSGMSGTLSDAAVFSFYVTKTMTTAEGGMITTSDEKLSKRMSVMRLHGMDRDAWDRYKSEKSSWEYDIVDAGYKFNLPDVLSAIGREQLKKADLMFEKRKKIVEYYNKNLKGLEYLILPPDGEGNAWHLYLIRVNPEKISCNRDVFAKELQKLGIGISMHFIALFNFTYWKKIIPEFSDPLYIENNFSNAKEKTDNTITLPLWPDMTVEMAEYVVDCIKKTGVKYGSF